MTTSLFVGLTAQNFCTSLPCVGFYEPGEYVDVPGSAFPGTFPGTDFVVRSL